MLVSAKEFEMKLSEDNLDKLFFVSNAMHVIRSAEYDYKDISRPTDEELVAPSLKLEVKAAEDFWGPLNSGYQNEGLDEELIEAMKGKSEHWKLVRCCTILSCEDKGFGFFFVLINPEAYRRWIASGKEVTHGQSLADDKQMGFVWVYTGYGHHDFEITEYRCKKNGKIKKHTTYQISVMCDSLFVQAYCKSFVRIMDARLSGRAEENPNFLCFRTYEECRYS